MIKGTKCKCQFVLRFGFDVQSKMSQHDPSSVTKFRCKAVCVCVCVGGHVHYVCCSCTWLSLYLSLHATRSHTQTLIRTGTHSHIRTAAHLPFEQNQPKPAERKERTRLYWVFIGKHPRSPPSRRGLHFGCTYSHAFQYAVTFH